MSDDIQSVEEAHGIYVSFHYGPSISFIALRGTDERRWHLSRTTINEQANMVLALVGIYDGIEEVRQAVQVEVARILIQRESQLDEIGHHRRAALAALNLER